MADAQRATRKAGSQRSRSRAELVRKIRSTETELRDLKDEYAKLKQFVGNSKRA
jgi:hypothetical protein